jgi:hypothetical protein
MVLLAGIWAGLVGLLIAAGEVVVRSVALAGFDHHATSVVVSVRTPALNSVMKAVTWLGSWVALLVTAIIIAVLVITRRSPVLAAVVAVFAWAGEAGGVRIGKQVIRRDRPPQAIWLVRAHGWSFPSGHAATACLAFTVLAVCVAMLARHRAVRIVGWLAAGLPSRRRVLPGGTGGALDDRCDRQCRLHGLLADRDCDLARRAPPSTRTLR